MYLQEFYYDYDYDLNIDRNVYYCLAQQYTLVKKWTIQDSTIYVKKSNNYTYRRNYNAHPLIPKTEYIGTFKTKKDIIVPPKRTVAYNCAMCRHSQCGMALKEIKGIDSDCCICLENKASILCTNCSAIHACLECVTKQCKLVPLVK